MSILVVKVKFHLVIRLLHCYICPPYSTFTLFFDFTFIQLKEVPWKSILTSVAVWSIALSEIGFGYGYYMMITEIPQYLVDVMHTDISEVKCYKSTGNNFW